MVKVLYTRRFGFISDNLRRLEAPTFGHLRPTAVYWFIHPYQKILQTVPNKNAFTTST